MTRFGRAALPDPGRSSGIGPDIALRALRTRRRGDGAPFFVLADPELLRRRAAMLGLDVDIAETEPEQARGDFSSRACPSFPLTPGRSARRAPRSRRRARDDRSDRPRGRLVRRRARQRRRHQPDRQIRAISRRLRPSRPYRIPGRTGRVTFRRNSRPVMMLWSRELAVVPAPSMSPLGATCPSACGRTIWSRSRPSSSKPARAISASRRRAWLSPGSIPMRARTARSAARKSNRRPRGGAAGAEGPSTSRGPLPADTMFHAPPRARPMTPPSACITIRR